VSDWSLNLLALGPIPRDEASATGELVKVLVVLNYMQLCRPGCSSVGESVESPGGKYHAQRNVLVALNLDARSAPEFWRLRTRDTLGYLGRTRATRPQSFSIGGHALEPQAGTAARRRASRSGPQ